MIIILLVIAVACRATEQASRSLVLPRVIYTFWEGPQSPVVQQCIRTWHHWAADWQIQMLDTQGALKLVRPEVLPADWGNLSIQLKSDLVRLEVLAARGGVWLDASVALTSPLEEWVQSAQEEDALVGFEMNFQGVLDKDVDPLGEKWSEFFEDNGRPKLDGAGRKQVDRPRASVYFESWAFAASRNNRAIQLWRDELWRAVSWDGGFEAYCKSAVEENESDKFIHSSLRHWLPYLVIHLTLARIRYLYPDLVIKSLPAEETAFRHTNYALDWSLVRVQRPSSISMDGTGGSVLAMGRGPREEPPPTPVGHPLIKLRSLDRPAFVALQSYGAYAGDSPFATVFNLPPPPSLWPVRWARYVAAFEARFGATDDPALVCTFWVLHKLFALLLFVVRGPVLIASLACFVGFCWMRPGRR